MQAGRYARLYWIAALACVVALVYWPSSFFLYQKWSDTAGLTYTHGWLILIICIVLVVSSRRELAVAPIQGSRIAMVALALAIVAWLVAYRASVEGVEVPLQPLIFWLAVTAAFGWSVGRLMLFPVAFFYFAVNVWYGTPLQKLTVVVMRALLAVTGPSASIVGDVIHIPNGAFVIEEGCSGLHFMIVGLAVAALYGEQRGDRWPVRLRQMALMAGLALIANWVRVYTVIEAGYLTNMQSYLVRVSHYGFGWCVFAVALFVFFWLAPHLGREPAPTTAPALPAGNDAVTRAQLAALAGAAAILIGLPVLNYLVRESRPASPLGNPLSVLNPQPPWHAVPVDVRSEWQPVFRGADELQRRAFGNSGDDTVEVLWVAYRTQRQDAELVGETSSLSGDGLQARAERVVGSLAGRFRQAELVDRAGEHSLIWWRYEVDGHNVVNPVAQQLWYGVRALVWRPSAGLIALRTRCHADCGGAQASLQGFVAHSGLR
jgi:exosortase